MRQRIVGLQHRVRRVVSARHRRRGLVGRPELWATKREFQIGFLRDAGLQPHHELLDLGCGVLRGGIPIIDLLGPGGYCGVEVRADLISEARRELAEAGLDDKRPELVHTADLATLHLPRRFDYIWSFSVLIHMSDEVVEGAFGFAARHLDDDGTFYANVNIGDREESAWQGFPVVSRSWEFYRDLATRHRLEIADMGALDELGHRSPTAQQNRGRMMSATLTG